MTMFEFNFSEEPRAIREAKEEGREEEALALVTRLLTRRLQQELPEETRSRLTALPLPVLRDLGDALFDFNTLEDLENWITEHRQSED